MMIFILNIYIILNILGIVPIYSWQSDCILTKLARWYMHIFFFNGGRLHIDDLSPETRSRGFYTRYFWTKPTISGTRTAVGISDPLTTGKYSTKNKWITMRLFVNYCLKYWNTHKLGIGFQTLIETRRHPCQSDNACIIHAQEYNS